MPIFKKSELKLKWNKFNNFSFGLLQKFDGNKSILTVKNINHATLSGIGNGRLLL